MPVNCITLGKCCSISFLNGSVGFNFECLHFASVYYSSLGQVTQTGRGLESSVFSPGLSEPLDETLLRDLMVSVPS